MAGGKQSPRQRMMGILYLVLLGLIALSVPDGLLDAFKNIKDSLDKSRENVTKGLQSNYTNFEQTTLKEQKARAQPIYDRAKKASLIADGLNNYIQNLRDTLVAAGGGVNPNINDVDARDNLDISPRFMVDHKHGEQLREKIDQTREALLACLTPKERTGINFSLNADPPKLVGGVSKTWEEANFGDGIPLGATLTTLAKVQTDDKNAENEVVKRILAEAQQATVNLDQFEAVAVAPVGYVLVGQPYTADVFLTAYDSKMNPNISVGGSPLKVEAGRGKYVGSTSSEGVHTWSAVIDVKQNDGTIKHYSTPGQMYTVARPSVVVSPTKMNVLYMGVPNPISVSAPGVANKDLHVSISSGSISGSNGVYEAKVTSLGTATVTVSGDLTKGKSSSLGSMLFRVKRIPDPKAEMLGKAGGNLPTATLRVQERIFAVLENFDFDAKFKVVRFTMTIVKPRSDPYTFSSQGNEFTSQMRQQLSTLSPGSIVFFSEIMAVGPDGSQRGLDPITFRAN